MINTIKPHYITIQPIVDNKAVLENSEVVITSPISGIYEIGGYEIMDHVFYLNSERELQDYELLYEFAEITLGMAKEYYADKYDNLDSVFVRFHDVKTGNVIFGLHVFDDEDGIDFTTVEFNDEDSEDFDCDGDCEHCSLYDENYRAYDLDVDIPIYYFGFEL